MGFLSFRKKSKANKAANPPSPPPPPLVLSDNIQTATAIDAGSEYHSPIADSFMMVGSSIEDMAQSSLSEDIFKELVPLSIKSESSTKSKDTIRHSLSLKSNSNSVKSSGSPLRINTAIHAHNDSTQSPLNASIISNTTRSSKQSDSSDSSLTSLSSTEEFVPLHPVSKSDPHHYANRKLGEHAPLIDLVSRPTPHEQVITSSTPSAAATATVPGLAMARMKERHRQEYRRSMQWSPPVQSLPSAPSSSSAAANMVMEYHPSSSRRADSVTSQHTHPMQHQQLPQPPPSSAPLVHARVQVPLINQIKPVVVPTRSMSSSTYTSKPFDRRPLIASIPPPLSHKQPKVAVAPAPDHRHYHLLYPSTSTRQYQAERSSNASHIRYPRQRLVGIIEHHHQQQPQDAELSNSSKLKTDYQRIVYTRKQDYVPDLVDLLDHQEEKQHPLDDKSSSRCSHHQPHHTMIKRQYNNPDDCLQSKQQQQHACSTSHRCNHHHHHHYSHCHHTTNRKPATCCNDACC